MKNFILFAVLSFTSVLHLQGQVRPDIQAIRTELPPKIDGSLTDDAWKSAPVATDFTEWNPNPGTKPDFKTEVRVLYDDEAIYVAAKLYDDHPNQIKRELSLRDNFNVNADFFYVIIDGFKKGQNAYGFGVTAAGVQSDVNFTVNDDDDAWDAVWRSEIEIFDGGWQIEYKIPYAALRFPNQEVQTWGLNFTRSIRRTREQYTWSAIDPKQDNVLAQSGTLSGIKNIKPPLRLSATPYVAAYATSTPDGNGSKQNERFVTGGMDIKYGINESFTLDMALIPDFGQVQFDNVELNLGPFEQRFSENRPFFTEGTEIFNRANLFYSRRVGNTPTKYGEVELEEGETIENNPEKTQLLNASKVSGRTKDGIGIGVFNAITNKTYADINTADGGLRKFLTEPLANYNVFAIDKQFDNNSYMSLVNTNVTRLGDFRDANVTGTEFKISNKKNIYAIEGFGSVSQIFNPNVARENGYNYFVEFGKVSGNLQYSIARNVESDTYDRNDLGFIFNNNEISHFASISYNTFEPIGKLNRSRNRISFNHQALYNPKVFSRYSISTNHFFVFQNFFATGANIGFIPTKNYDYFEARTPGQKFERPAAIEGGGWISSDYRKTLAIDANIGYSHAYAWEQKAAWFGIDPRIRVNNQFSIFPGFNIIQRWNNVGYATIDENNDDDIIFGRRDRRDIDLGLRMTYLFTNKMSLTLRGRHYWALVEYNEYYDLKEDGTLGTTTFSDDLNTNFNAFNVDMVYRWIFAPGSELNLIWKTSANTFTRSIITDYRTNFSDMLDQDQTNIFSIKVLYYIDYPMVRGFMKQL